MRITLKISLQAALQYPALPESAFPAETMETMEKLKDIELAKLTKRSVNSTEQILGELAQEKAKGRILEMSVQSLSTALAEQRRLAEQRQ